jgi:hypothetical protein
MQIYGLLFKLAMAETQYKIPVKPSPMHLRECPEHFKAVFVQLGYSLWRLGDSGYSKF